MTERRDSEELSRAARQMADAARKLSLSVDRLAELEARAERTYQRFLGNIERLVEGGGGQPSFSEQDAVFFAVRSVHEVREDLWAGREAEAPAPDSEDIEHWEMTRSEHRDRAGYEIS